MGLKETIQAAVKSGFTALGNLKTAVTYRVYSVSSTYVPATGTYTRTETDYTVNGVFLDYKKRDIDGEIIKPHDQRFLVLQADLATAPTLQDRIIANGKIWEVISVGQDPALATWELQVRSRNG